MVPPHAALGESAPAHAEAPTAPRTVVDVAPAANVALTTGGRALVSGPILSSGSMDIFANNEGYSGGRRLMEANATVRRRARRSRRRLSRQRCGCGR